MRLIDGEAFLAAWEAWLNDDEDKRSFTELVEDMPIVVDAEPVVHARWERCFEDWRQQFEGDECSACGIKHYGMAIDHYHYCPNCGAKMDGGSEE